MPESPTRWFLRALVFIGIFLALGLRFLLALRTFSLNPVFVGQITIDLGTLAFFVIMTIAGIGLVASLISWFWQRRGVKALAHQASRHRIERRQFVQRLDHELKNPLTILQTGLAGLPQQAASVSETHEFQLAQQQVTRLRRLIQDLRKLTDIETYTLETEPIHLAELLPEVIGTFQGSSEPTKRDVSLTVQRVPWTPPPVLGDRDLLVLAFYNLLDNAFKFTQPTDTIELHLYEDNNQVTIDIADSGIGIPAEELPLVFEELYRGENSRGIEGRGLGLPLVKRIIERHGGTISIRSRLGKGTICTVRLPCA